MINVKWLENKNEWVILRDYPNYAIKYDGSVKNITSGRVLKPSIGKRGYVVFNLMHKDGRRRLVTLHRLIAMTFIPNPLNLPEVNHIDGDKTNYNINNLEWVTTRDNNIHARKTGLRKSNGDKPVVQIKDGEIINEFQSISAASRETGIPISNISNVCRGGDKYTHRLTAGGYVWKWRNDCYAASI